MTCQVPSGIKLPKGWQIFAIGMVLLFFHNGNYWQGHWYSKWAFLIAAFSIWISVCVAQKTSWYLFPIVACSLLSAASTGAWAENVYSKNADPISLLALEKNSLYAYIVVLVSALFVYHFKLRWRRASVFYLATVSIVCSLFMLLVPRYHGLTNGPYLGNASMAGCLVAALFPFLYLQLGHLFQFKRTIGAAAYLVTLAAIYKTDSSAPIVVIAATTISYLVAMYGKRAVIPSLFCGSLLALIGHLTVKHQPFIHDSGRLYIWKLMGQWWMNHSNHIFGMGLGTIQIITPIVQVVDNPKVGQYFLWLHNEWLQVLMEMGAVGFISLFLAWWYFAKRSYRTPTYFASFIGFTTMAMMNYPLRLPVHAFSLAIICSLITI